MILSQTNAWNVDCGPAPLEPGPNAQEKEVGEYLHEMDLLGAFDGHLDRGTILRYCHHQGHLRRPFFKLASVISGLEDAAAATRRSSLGPIPSDDKEWKSLREWGQVPARALRCPLLIWRMDKKSGDVYSFRADCDTYLCATCAKAKAEGHLKWACRQFPHHDRVWVTAVPDDELLTDRLRKRRERMRRQTGRAEGAVWVRRADGTIHVFSTEDLSEPVDEPRQGEWRSPAAALEGFLDLSLALPGIMKVGWSGAWKRPAQRRSTGRTYNLREQPTPVMDEAMIEAGDALAQQYGVDALEQMSDDLIETIWLPMVESAIEHQWHIRMQAG